jgi:hypothetical protein
MKYIKKTGKRMEMFQTVVGCSFCAHLYDKWYFEVRKLVLPRVAGSSMGQVINP